MDKWKSFISTNSIALVLVLLAFVCSAFLFNWSLQRIDGHTGSIPFEPFFHLYEAKDLSHLLFFLTYGSLILYLVYYRREPGKWYVFLKAYVILLLTRSFCVYLYPLAAPSGAIPLNDPVLNHLFYPNSYSSRDLFYSGHVCTVLLLAAFSDAFWLKSLLFLFAIVIAVALVLQKVHYTIDVVFAPVFAIVIVKLSRINWPKLVK